MASVLKRGVARGAPVLPLHDRPASHFQPMPDDIARRECLASLPLPKLKEEEGDIRVLVSSTSWTPDEDFSLLIDALCRYGEVATTEKPDLPAILAIITGKGPQREMYVDQISRLQREGKLKKVVITALWLSFPDYARLLASASLGVSLHTSSSGVDLPMKVVDMFGAGLPVVGWDRYESWSELVNEGIDGMGFGSWEELAAILVDLFGHSAKLDALRRGAEMQSLRRWDDEWDPIVGKLFFG